MRLHHFYRMNKITESCWKSLLTWHKGEGRHDLPWRKINAPWAIFVAENLLRRTRSANVARIYNSIIKEFPSPKSVIEHEERWQEITSSLGIGNRAHHFFATCYILTDKHNGYIPDQYYELTALPGVGHYIANAVLCFAYNIPTYIVDTNTLRVASRITGIKINQEEHRSQKARIILKNCFGGDGGLYAAQNYALLDLAHSICTASNPKCQHCPLSRICHYASNINDKPGKAE